MTERVNLLSEVEQHALEKGAHQRAKALAALEEMATVLGMSDDVIATMAAGIRRLGKGDAREAWRNMGDMNEIADYLKRVSEKVRFVESEPAVTTDVKTIELGDRPYTEPIPFDDYSEEEQREDVVLYLEASPGLEVVNAVEHDTNEAEEVIHVDHHKLMSFYRSINSKTREPYLTIVERPNDIDSDELMGILELYGRSSRSGSDGRRVELLLGSLLHGQRKMAEMLVNEGAQMSQNSIEKSIANVRTRAAGIIAKKLDALFTQDGGLTEPAATRPLRSKKSQDKLSGEALDWQHIEVPETTHYDEARVKSFLDRLRNAGVNVGDIESGDFTSAVYQQLAEAYLTYTEGNQDIARSNVACTWGWLSGLSTQELMEMKRDIKPNVSRNDVDNARSKMILGIEKAQRYGWKFQPQPAATAVGESQALSIERGDITISKLVPEETAEKRVSKEFKGDDERRADIMDRFAAHFSHDISRAAFDGILDKANKGEMTAAKQNVFEQIRTIVSSVSPDSSVIGMLDVDSESRALVRRFTGLGFTKNGQPVEHAPTALKDMFPRGASKAKKDELTSKLYDGLEALLAKLDTLEQKQEETVVVTEKNGVPQIAW